MKASQKYPHKQNDGQRDLDLIEYEPLRDEVNRTINRMTTNEVLCAGFVFSIIYFLITYDGNSKIPEALIRIYAAIIAILVSLYGKWRSEIFRRHMDQVDEYLAKLELRFSKNGGWTNHYLKTMANTDKARQHASRATLWHVVSFTALLNLLIQICVLISI